MSTDVVSDPALLEPQPSGPSSDHASVATAATTAPTAHAAAPTSAPVSKQDVNAASAKDQIECAKPAAPVFLNSPPDSNNATKSDASDSELSELEDEPILDDPPCASTPAPAPESVEEPATVPTEQTEEEEDIGEVLPDDWSGAVPIFRPTLHQFKDFQKFVRFLNVTSPVVIN